MQVTAGAPPPNRCLEPGDGRFVELHEGDRLLVGAEMQASGVMGLGAWEGPLLVTLVFSAPCQAHHGLVHEKDIGGPALFSISERRFCS